MRLSNYLKNLPAILAISTVSFGLTHAAFAHGFAGERFFPATVATDDPFVADELSLPTVQFMHNPAGDGASSNETDISVDFSKTITKNFGIGVGEAFMHLEPKGGPIVNGFGNLGVNGKYLVAENDKHEFLFSVGLDAEVGGTGTSSVGADEFSTLTPGVFFGKGLGDLPDDMKYLKPLAITGTLGISFPTERYTTADDGSQSLNPNFVNTGLAIEYSLPYLQSHVEALGLPAPLNRMIPLVELSFQTPINGDSRYKTTGTINPGVAWVGQYSQITTEAILPINDRTSNGIGGIVQLHFFLDDLFPDTIGKPLFGG